MQKAQVEDWRAGRQRLAARLRVGQMRVVAESGHFVALDQPAAVIAAVRAVVDAVRRSAAP